MERKTLPAREKQIQEDEWHLFCPGEGCSARLGIRKGLMVTLEPCYTNAPHPNYPAGTWWKQKRSKGWPRARDAREAMRDIDKATEGVPPEAVDQVIKETLKRGDLLDNAWITMGRQTGPLGARLFRESTQYRDIRPVLLPSRGKLRGASSFLSWGRWLRRPRVALPPGTHTVVCGNCRCGGLASIKAPIAGTLGQKS
jgi:hypothetical protein